MKALDIAIYLWILQLCLFIVGNVYGAFTYDQPSALIGKSDIENIIAHKGEQPIDTIKRILSQFLTVDSIAALGGALVIGGIALASGRSVFEAILLAISIGVGLFFFGRILWYAFSIGSLIKAIVEGFTYGYATVDPSIEWGLNVIGYIISFMAVMDWWRGISTRQMG